MPKLVREPAQKQPMGMLKAAVVESAANTYTQIDVNTPVNPNAFAAMRIHQIRFEMSVPDIVADTRTHVTVILRTNSATSMGFINDEGVIAKSASVSVDQAAGAIAQEQIAQPLVWDFGEQGILVVDANLHFGIIGTANTAAKTGRIVILYTLESLEPHEYIAALTLFGGQA